MIQQNRVGAGKYLSTTLSLLIRNADIIDGSGNPTYRGDIAIEKDRIVDIGHFPHVTADLDIDATGKAVCPGFIDVHSHSELAMLAGNHTAGVLMGVTSEFTCPDGFCFAPLPRERLNQYRHYLYGIYGDADIGWDWSRFGDYLNHFEGNVFNNVAAQVPHGAVRLAVMGWGSNPHSPKELDAMRQLTRECMEAGALGLNAGLDYSPAAHAGLHELVELSKVVAQYGGVYAAHIRGYGPDERETAIRETITIAEEAGIGVHISHFFGTPDIYASMEAAHARGIDITFDAYPYTAGSTFLTIVLPRTLMTSDFGKFLETLKTNEIKQMVGRAFERNIPEDHPAYFAYLDKPHNKWMEGKRVRDTWRNSGKTFGDYLCDLILDEGIAPLLIFPWPGGSQENDEIFLNTLTHPLHMVSTDGIYIGGSPHPRGWGTYPRIVGQYVREKGWLTLEDAIRRMTGFPAKRFGLHDRGLVKKGMMADLVIFDAMTIKDMATFELPRLPPTGIEYVFVNGIPVVERGTLNADRRPGRLLRLHD